MTDVLTPANTTVGSGAYNKRVSFEQPVEVDDGQGGVTTTWTTILTTWAHIDPWRSWRTGEMFVASQVYPVSWVQVLLRYRPSTNITTVMRMRYGTRIYNVRTASVPAEAETTIELLCEQLQSGGTLH